MQQLKRSNSQNPEKKALKEKHIKSACQDCLNLANILVAKVVDSIGTIKTSEPGLHAKIIAIEGYIAHAKRQIDQIEQRAINGETIAHENKVFSIFEAHTEWISKGKAGVPVELGLRVCVVKDQFGFILHHQVMEHQTNDQIAISAFPGTPDFICHLHFLRDIGKDLFGIEYHMIRSRLKFIGFEQFSGEERDLWGRRWITIPRQLALWKSVATGSFRWPG